MASELTRAKAQIQSIRRRGAELEQTIVRKAVITGVAAAAGYAESKGLAPSYFGVPTKLLGAMAGSLLQLVTRDASANRLLAASSDALMAAYAFEAGKQHTFIAGDEDGGSL